MDGRAHSGIPCFAGSLSNRSFGMKPVAPVISIDQPGRLRNCNLMALYNVSRPTLHRHIKQGKIPRSDGKDGSKPYWNTWTIHAHMMGTADTSKPVFGAVDKS